MQYVIDDSMHYLIDNEWGGRHAEIFRSFPVTRDLMDALKRLFPCEARTEQDLYILNGVMRERLSSNAHLPEPREEWRRVLASCLRLAGERHINFYMVDTEKLDKQTGETV